MTPAFVDHYETLQLSPNATAEVVERVHRILAKRYHPDNQDSGDVVRFENIQAAYEVLSDPERRAQYDVNYDVQRTHQWKVFDQQCACDSREEDSRIIHGILSLLYAARRMDPKHGGLGALTLEAMLGCPEQHLEFPLWYLKNRGYVKVEENGHYGITVDGVDKLSKDERPVSLNRLLPSPSSAASPPVGRTLHAVIAS